MSRASYLASWIIRAELHLVGIMHPSTEGTLHHSRLLLSCCLVWIHDNVRLPHAIREAAMLVAFNNILHRNITPGNASCGCYPYNSTCTSLAACPVGDTLALLEVAEWSQGPVQVLKLFIKCGHVHSSLASELAQMSVPASRLAAQIAIGVGRAPLEQKGCFYLFG